VQHRLVLGRADRVAREGRVRPSLEPARRNEVGLLGLGNAVQPAVAGGLALDGAVGPEIGGREGFVTSGSMLSRDARRSRSECTCSRTPAIAFRATSSSVPCGCTCALRSASGMSRNSWPSGASWSRTRVSGDGCSLSARQSPAGCGPDARGRTGDGTWTRCSFVSVASRCTCGGLWMQKRGLGRARPGQAGHEGRA
jgi:hypothetical protein